MIKGIIHWFLYEDGHLDWLKHLILGTGFFILVFIIIQLVQEDRGLSLTVANFATVFLGAGKELYDHGVKNKSAEGRDIFFTALGGVCITILLILI